MGINNGKLKVIADLHTHSIASVHAYATITEMAIEARDLGLFALAVTDHAHIPEQQYFYSLVLIPEYLKNVRLLRGIEANICDYNGNVDVPNDLMDRLDLTVASMHMANIDGQADFEKCTNAYLKLAENPRINIIGHSGSEYFRYDYEKVIPEFARNGKLVEINDSAFRYKKEFMGNCIRIAQLCKKYNARICVNTDSHFTDTLGRPYCALKALEEMDFPEKLIVNSSVENLKSYFDEQHINY